MTKSERDAADILADAIAGTTPPTQSDAIQSQIESWTNSALDNLAGRISVGLWQAYRAGQASVPAQAEDNSHRSELASDAIWHLWHLAQEMEERARARASAKDVYSEAGHELAAQEAERLRAKVTELESFRALDTATIKDLGDRLVAVQAELERDKRALASIAWALEEKREALTQARRERDEAREELHLAETSLVTTAKERDDAADALREARAELESVRELHAQTYASLVQTRDESARRKAHADRLEASLAQHINDLNDAVNDRDAARAELADLRAGISALTSGRAA